MSERIRLDRALTVEVAGQRGVCPEISLEELLVQGVSPGEGPIAVSLRAPGVDVRGVVEHVSGGEGAALYRFRSFEAGHRDTLVGWISSLRKDAHLRIVATEDVEAKATKAGWDRYRFPHDPMPDRHPDHLDLTVPLLGKTLAAPLMISGMTGGSARAGEINRRLATAAQELGLAMGLGSQRAMIELPELTSTFEVRAQAPDILLAANVGAVQLNCGVTTDDVRRLVDAVQADVLAVHLNVLQEMVQPEGDRDWSGLRRKLGALIEALDVPVLLKETGCGMTGDFARAARDLGASALDVGGTGGTSWGWIEGFRAADPQRQALGATFRDWGVPTADAVVSCRAALGPDFPIIATGGVRTGLDAATAVALGADVAGMALPFFRAADVSAEAAISFGRRVIEELRIATLCSGAASARGLRDVPLEPR